MKAFADTFFFLAFRSPSDKWHGEAASQMQRYRGQLVTTECVLVELADAMADPRDRPACIDFINALRNDPDVQIVPSTPKLLTNASSFTLREPTRVGP